MESGVHLSLHPNCHHQIIYYPPPYEREVWHYHNADFNAIKNAITDFSWERAFENLSVDEKVSLFDRTIKNILSNYIPHEIITIDDIDPPWFNPTCHGVFLAFVVMAGGGVGGGGRIPPPLHSVLLNDKW